MQEPMKKIELNNVDAEKLFGRMGKSLLKKAGVAAVIFGGCVLTGAIGCGIWAASAGVGVLGTIGASIGGLLLGAVTGGISALAATIYTTKRDIDRVAPDLVPVAKEFVTQVSAEIEKNPELKKAFTTQATPAVANDTTATVKPATAPEQKL